MRRSGATLFPSRFCGIVAVSTGIWAVVKFKMKKGDTKPSKSGVSADRGSMAAGRDISINPRGPSKR
jgi:hypothetical protein